MALARHSAQIPPSARSLPGGSDRSPDLLGASDGPRFPLRPGATSAARLSCSRGVRCSNPDQSSHAHRAAAGRKGPPFPSLPFPPGWLYLKRTLIKASENVRFLEIKYLKALPCCLPHPPSNRLSPRQGNACLKAEPVSVFTSPWPSPLEDLPDHELVL